MTIRDRHAAVIQRDGTTYVEILPVITWLLDAADTADSNTEPHAAKALRKLCNILSRGF